jgi:hypothetical protein
MLLHSSVRHSLMATMRIKSSFLCGGREDGAHAGRTVRDKSVSALQRICIQCYNKQHVRDKVASVAT